MDDTKIERGFILFFRLAMAWVFLYAASHQVGTDFSVVGFLRGTKTFHDIYAVFASPSLAPVVSLLVAYGHLLIGLSLAVGLLVRVSSAFGVMLMLFYWTAHMDFPYISNTNNFLLDEHIVYAAILLFLIYKQAGRVFGLDALLPGGSLLVSRRSV